MTQERYDAALKSAQQAADAQAKRLSDEINTARAQIDQLNDAIKKAQARAADQDRVVAAARGRARRDLQTKLDAATAENEQLRKELTRLGKNADALLSEKGTLSTALADAKARLEELRRAQEAAEARAKQFKQLVAKFQRMIDAGQLKVALRNGHMVIQLANDVLFDSGRTDIKAAGQDAIKQVAVVLKTIPDRHFQVAGDTDNVPIQTPLFPSNWELSTRRAVEVVRASLRRRGFGPRRCPPLAMASSTPSRQTTLPKTVRRIDGSRSPSSQTSMQARSPPRRRPESNRLWQSHA